MKDHVHDTDGKDGIEFSGPFQGQFPKAGSEKAVSEELQATAKPAPVYVGFAKMS